MKEKIDPTQLPTVPSLVGKNVYLRPMEPHDNEITYQWFLASDPATQSRHQPVLTTAAAYVEWRGKREPDPKRGEFLIVRIEDNQPVGKLSYHDLNMLTRSAELGYLVAPGELKKGYGKEALRLLIYYLFSHMNLNKVYAQTGAFNKASIKLLESLDFKLDGTLRQHHYYKGELHDDLVYSLLKFESNP